MKQIDITFSQPALGWLEINGEESLVLSPRLRKIPLGEWTPDDMAEEAELAKIYAAEAEVEAKQATVKAERHSAWAEKEIAAGRGDDLSFGRFVREMGYLKELTPAEQEQLRLSRKPTLHEQVEAALEEMAELGEAELFEDEETGEYRYRSSRPQAA